MKRVGGPLDGRRRSLVASIPRSLFIAVAALLLFGWISDQVLEQETGRTDEALRAQVHRLASPSLTLGMKIISALGSRSILLPLMIVLLAVLMMKEKGREAIFLTVTMAGAVGIEITLKLVFHRPRPPPFFDLAMPGTYAFPSGHALVSLCFYGVLAWMLTQRLQSRLTRVLVWLAAGLLVGLIGISRIYLGVHYPSDVIGGYAAAGVWLGAVITVSRRIRRG